MVDKLGPSPDKPSATDVSIFLAESGFEIEPHSLDPSPRNISQLIKALQKKFQIKDEHASSSLRVCDAEGLILAPEVTFLELQSSKIFVFCKDATLIPNLIPQKLLEESEQNIRKSVAFEQKEFPLPENFSEEEEEEMNARKVSFY